MHTHFKCTSKAFSGWHLCWGGVCQSVSGWYFPGCAVPARAHPLYTPRSGSRRPPKPPSPRKGRGAATHWLRRLPRAQYPAQEPPPGAPQATPQFASAPQPRHSALRAPRPCHSPLIFLRPLTLIPLPSRSRAAPRAEPTATPRAVPEAQPPLLLEPHQRELLAAAIMVSWGEGLKGTRRAECSRAAETRLFSAAQEGAESGVTPPPCFWVHHRQGLREEGEEAQRVGGGAGCPRMSRWGRPWGLAVPPADHVQGQGRGLHDAPPASRRRRQGYGGSPRSGPPGLGGGGTARPPHPHPAGLPSRAYPWRGGSAFSARWRRAAASQTPAAVGSLRDSPVDFEGQGFLG